MTQTAKRFAIGLSICAVGLAAGGVVWRLHNADRAAKARLEYRAGGYGGFAVRASPAPHPAPARAAAKSAVVKAGVTPDAVPAVEPLTAARAAYAGGDYRAAEAAAGRVVANSKAAGLSRPSIAVASAQHLMAFAAARRGDLKTARERFASAEATAKAVPKAVASPVPGQLPAPTLAEDAAYQHAVCTMGLGDQAGAETEFVQFVRDFPESPLVHSVMLRIGRLHGGDIPKDAEAVWKVAQAKQQTAQAERERQAALCAPECLAHLLPGVPVETLAKEMATDGRGTSVWSFVATAHRHGFAGAQGVRLTEAGLRKQTLPVVALVAPGHFVVVNKITDNGLTVWDGGTGAGTSRVVPWDKWRQLWQGGQMHGAFSNGVAVRGLAGNGLASKGNGSRL